MQFDAAKMEQLLRQRDAERGIGRASEAGMRGIGRTVSASSLGGYLRKHLFICLLAGLFLAGMLSGTLLVGHASEDTRRLLDVVLGGYLEKRQVQSFAALFASTFSSTAVALLILFFCGFCSISQVIILAIPFLKGLGYGFSLGAFYAEYGFPAMPYVMLLLFPAMLFSTLLLLAACKTSFILSLRLLRTAMTPSEQSERFRMQRYCIKYGAYTVFCIAIAIFDAILFYRLNALFVL